MAALRPLYRRLRAGAWSGDVWASGSRWVPDKVIDFSARHPGAANELDHGSWSTTGATAARGEADKHRTYPPGGGITVLPFVQETFGRLGPNAELILADYAAAVVRKNITHGLPPANPTRRWRAQISAGMARHIARAIRAAQPGLQVLGYAPINPVARLSRDDEPAATPPPPGVATRFRSSTPGQRRATHRR